MNKKGIFKWKIEVIYFGKICLPKKQSKTFSKCTTTMDMQCTKTQYSLKDTTKLDNSEEILYQFGWE